MHFYSKDEIKYLKKISPGKTNKEITMRFNKKFRLDVTENAMNAIRKKYGIKTGNNTKWQKGHSTWNKGMKGLTIGGKQTQFKKGNRPHNYKAIGSERVNADGYVDIKIADGQKQKNWKGKHILIWEKENGPVPKGYAVIFGDKNNRNFDIENLVLVSRKQLLIMNKNNLIKNDPELTRTGVIVADLIQKIHDKKS